MNKQKGKNNFVFVGRLVSHKEITMPAVRQAQAVMIAYDEYTSMDQLQQMMEKVGKIFISIIFLQCNKVHEKTFQGQARKFVVQYTSMVEPCSSKFVEEYGFEYINLTHNTVNKKYDLLHNKIIQYTDNRGYVFI